MSAPGDPLAAELRRIFGAVRFLWPGAFSFAGRLVQAAVPAPGERVDPLAPPPVVLQLQHQLYLGCYCVPFAGRPGGFPPEPADASAEREAFVQCLAEANAGRERRISGVLRPRESRRLDEDFYFAFAETPGLLEDRVRLVRLYWNVGRAAAPRLVAVLTRRLNRFRLPFQLKCLSRPRQFERLDAAVLFVQRRHFRTVAELLAESWPELAPGLGLRTP
ncbi:MAG TPA: T3SS effector HopA1 family protein, partial [Thermoanaerobaculia bacterium]|nr:T3SS effector HopA1 family protein [Thermoanaerobaculia bacterium]